MGGGKGGYSQAQGGGNVPSVGNNTNPLSGPDYYTNGSSFLDPGTLESYRQRAYGDNPMGQYEGQQLNPNYGKDYGVPMTSLQQAMGLAKKDPQAIAYQNSMNGLTPLEKFQRQVNPNAGRPTIGTDAKGGKIYGAGVDNQKYLNVSTAEQAQNQALYDKQIAESRGIKNVMDIGQSFMSGSQGSIFGGSSPSQFSNDVSWGGQPSQPMTAPVRPTMYNNYGKTDGHIYKGGMSSPQPAQGQGQATKANKAPAQPQTAGSPIRLGLK